MTENNNKKIVLITSGQPSLNPRLVKEADALSSAGYTVTVLYAYWNDWGTQYDLQLLGNKKWKAIRVGGHPQQKRNTYTLSRVINKVAKLIFPLAKWNIIADWALSRATYFLIREAKKHKADLYIAHNPGALPAAVIAAKHYNKPCGFDAEDFHRNEISNDIQDSDVILKSYIENKYIPQLAYFTTSSTQIAEAYRQIFPLSDPIVLLNVFPNSPVTIAPQTINKPLKLFWFSQTIGPNRGIDDIVKALQLLNSTNVELHLLGSKLASNLNYLDWIKKSGIQITFHEPISPNELINFASNFDVGLALEPGFSNNNNLALSNKLFTYMQAGLAIVASDTTAQHDLLSKNPGIGQLYPKGNCEALAAIISKYIIDKDQLLTQKTESLRLAHEQYNWETESRKLLSLVKITLKPIE